MLARYLPQAEPRFEDLYVNEVAAAINASKSPLVVDVGGGKGCCFAHTIDPGVGAHLVCVDVSESEMRHNSDVHEKRVADIMRELPFQDDSVDLIVSRSVLEHLESQESFFRESYRILKPGGKCIHFFPSKFAPFALINQALPGAVARRLVQGLYDESKGILGFPAHYHGTYRSAFDRILAEEGFTIERVRVCYYQSGYFSFFVPLFLLSAVYELLIRSMGLENLGAYLIVHASKASPESFHGP